ncbi:hypothetical protein [Streptomyces sp. DG1A-41]|uniref:hypothetical protein n=1 Tax=Streptomyces sp. DG1A-41 TaxID=3125779 RepID=UPI0030CFDA69
MRGPALSTYARAPRRHRIRRRADMPLIGGVRPPVAILMVLLLSVAGLTVYALGSISSEQLPLAVRDSEQQIAADAAVSVRGSISAEANTLRRAAEAYTPTSTTAPATALKTVVAGRRSVHGVALVDPATGHLLAASGVTVPLAGIGVGSLAADAERSIVPPRLVAAASGARILYFARLTVPEHSQDTNADQSQDQTQQQTKHWLVVVLEPLPTPAAHGDGRGTWLVGETAPSWRALPACGPSPAPTGRSPEPQPGPPRSPDGGQTPPAACSAPPPPARAPWPAGRWSHRSGPAPATPAGTTPAAFT